MFNKNKLSIPNLIIKTFGLVPELLPLGRIFLTYTLMLTLLYAVFGQWSHSCHSEDNGWWCFSLSGSKYIVISVWVAYFLTQLYLFISFCYDVYKVAYDKEIFNPKRIFAPDWKKLRGMGVIFAYLLAFVLPMALGLQIILKEPNPNWRIEFIYFLVLFALCWMPIWTIRLSGGLSYFLETDRKPSFSTIIKRTSGRNISIVLTFCVFIMLINVINLQVSTSLNMFALKNNYFAVAVIAEMVGVFLKLAYLAFILGFFRAQQQILRSMDEEETGISLQEETALTADNENAALETTEEKSSRPLKKSVKNRKNAALKSTSKSRGKKPKK